MNCPKCDKQNPDDAQVCTFCRAVLNPASATTEEITTKTSGLAIASLVLAILSVFSCGITAIPAIILGIIGYVKIEKSGGRITGSGLAITGIVISIVGLCLLGVMLPALKRIRGISGRMVCGSNLAQIGRAMLVYGSGYEDPLPLAGGPGTIWQTKINNWRGRDRISAFNLKPDATGGSATISSSFYLLVKYGELEPKLFVCPGDPGTTEFKPAEYGALEKDIDNFWDFGPNPSKHCSYSYHMPYGSYALSFASSQPGMAIAADRNPWINTAAVKARDFSLFKWDGNTRQQKAGNAITHKGDGQNVFFVDGHVAFEKRAFCGVNDDNIYTYWDGADIRQGAPPVIGSQPKDKLDSLLVNDPPLNNSK